MQQSVNKLPRGGLTIKEEHYGKNEIADPTAQMSHCPKCGDRVSSEMKFCPKCGTPLGVAVQPSSTKVRKAIPKAPDILGPVSAGVVLIVFALTYIRNPIGFSLIADYFETMGRLGAFVKPPPILLDAGIFFFYVIGIWGIVLSGLRIVLERKMGKALGDLFGGLFSLFVVSLLTNYASDIFTGRTALAYFVIAIGLLVIANTMIYFAFPERQK